MDNGCHPEARQSVVHVTTLHLKVEGKIRWTKNTEKIPAPVIFAETALYAGSRRGSFTSTKRGRVRCPTKPNLDALTDGLTRPLHPQCEWLPQSVLLRCERAPRYTMMGIGEVGFGGKGVPVQGRAGAQRGRNEGGRAVQRRESGSAAGERFSGAAAESPPRPPPLPRGAGVTAGQGC